MSKDEIKQARFETRKLSQLTNWDNNPRSILKEDYARLKGQISKLGVYKTLLVNQDNIVLGGNMRLRAFTELFGKDHEVMCGIVETADPGMMLEYALSDNDQVGTTDEQKLAEDCALHPIESELYAINSSPMKLVSKLKEEVSPNPDGSQPEDKCRHCPVHCEGGG